MIELYSRCKEKRSRKIEMRVNLKNNTFLYIESGCMLSKWQVISCQGLKDLLDSIASR